GRVLLLVRPPKTGAGTAMFLLGESGQLAMDHATVEFPFNLRELAAEASPAGVVAPVPAAKPAARGGIGWKIGAGVIAVIGSVVGLNGLGVFDGPKPQAAPAVVETQAPVVEPPATAVIPEPALVKPISKNMPPVIAPRVEAPARKLVEIPRAQPPVVAE